MAIEITIRIDEEDEKITVEQDDGRLYLSQYARFFDETSSAWDKNPELNYKFLRHAQEAANELLESHGYLFLNDVYEMLGMSRTKVGQLVGWIYDEEDPDGDNYVDFDICALRNTVFFNGYSTKALLDFNVDGVILDKI